MDVEDEWMLGLFVGEGLGNSCANAWILVSMPSRRTYSLNTAMVFQQLEEQLYWTVSQQIPNRYY